MTLSLQVQSQSLDISNQFQNVTFTSVVLYSLTLNIYLFWHRSFIEDSKAGIKISPMDNTYCGLSDRLVTLSGTLEVQMRAIGLILNKLTEDDDYSQQVHSPNSYAGRPS